MNDSDPLSLAAAATDAPGRIFLVTDERAWTVAEVARAVAARRVRIARDTDTPDRPLAIELTAALESTLWLLALIEEGRPVVPIHPQLTETERAYLLTNSGARLVTPAPVEPEGHAVETPPPLPIDPERALAIVYTSGTSGRPKGAVLSRRAFVASARANRANLGRWDDDRWLLALPPAHVGGLSIVVRALVDRTAVVLWGAERIDVAGLAATTVRHRVTLVSLVPTMLHRLLEAGLAFAPNVRAVLLGGAAAPPPLLAAAADRGVPVLTTYGLTEACSQVTTQPYGTAQRGEAGAGLPVAGTTVRIRDGRILVRGPTMFSGYHPLGASPSPFDPGGFFDTGDHGDLDARGNLHVRGRRSDLIVVGGENVYPAEVEQAALEVPGLADACAFGVPDAEWGERVALVVVGAGGLTPDLDAVVATLATRLARHKLPTLGACATALPYRGIGKLDRRAAAATLTPALRPMGRRGR
jgi:O-succinylbenzoic acid--CoA ligase